MNWYSIGLGAAAGALAGMVGFLVARLLVKDEKIRMYVSVALIVVLMNVFNSVLQERFLPQLNQRSAAQDFDTVFLDESVFQTLRTLEPDTYVAMRTAYVDAVGEGLGAIDMQQQVRNQLSTLISQRLPRASNEAILSYMGVVGDQIEALLAIEGDACFKLLFPAVDGGIDANTAFTDKIKQRDLQALELTLKSYDATRYIPADDEALPIVSPVYQSLFEKYGESAVADLQDPAGDNVDRRRLCDMVRELYAGILDHPEEDAVTALRWMLAEG